MRAAAFVIPALIVFTGAGLVPAAVSLPVFAT